MKQDLAKKLAKFENQRGLKKSEKAFLRHSAQLLQALEVLAKEIKKGEKK